jgi:hypothetical protein
VADKAGNSAATDVEVIRPHLDNGTIRAEFTDYGTSGDRIPHSTAVSASIAWLPISTSTQVYSWEGNLHYDDGGGVANHLLADPDEFTVAYALHREGDPLTLGSRIENSEFRIVATHSLNEATLETQLQVTNIAGRDLAGVNFAWLLDADLVLPQPDPCCPPLPWLGFGAGRWSGPDGQGVQTNLNLCAGLVPANIEVRHLARLDGTLVPNAWSVCNPAGFQGSTCHFDGPVQGEPRYLFNLPFDNTAGCVGFDQDLGIVTGYAVPQWPSGVTHAFTYTLTFRQPGDGDMNGDGVVDLGDMDLFVAVLLGQDTDWCRISSADLDHSGSADGLDIQLFVNLLLAP